MDFVHFPNELLLMIAKNLDKLQDVSCLLQVNRHFASLFTPLLHDLALRFQYYRKAALFWAAAGGHEHLVRTLVGRAFKTEVEHGDRKLVHEIPGTCDEGTLKWVLEKGANLVISDAFPLSALQWAAFHGHRPLASLLLSKGADISIRDNTGRTALCWAVQCQQKMIIDLFMEKGELTFTDEAGRTLLHVAVEHCDETVVGSLLDRGADITAMENLHNFTPLLVAVQCGDKALALTRALLERGADTEVRDNLGRVALHLAAGNKRGKGVKTVELLIERGIDVNVLDTYQRTALHIAVQSKCPIVDLLLEKGAAVDARDIFGRTALLLAAQQNWAEAVRLLLEKGADHTIPDYSGRMMPEWVLKIGRSSV